MAESLVNFGRRGERRPTLGLLLRAAAARQTRHTKASSPLPPSNRLIINSAAPYLPAPAAAASPAQVGRPPSPPCPLERVAACGFLRSASVWRCISFSAPLFFLTSHFLFRLITHRIKTLKIKIIRCMKSGIKKEMKKQEQNPQ